MKQCGFILILLGLAGAALAAHDLSQEYRFSASLAGDDYILHWTADLQNKTLSAAVNVSTTGWVGFGFSPNGQMPGSDVIIAWVNSKGEVLLHDRHAIGRFLPPIDSSQDWTLVSGEEQDGRTIIEFTRPFLSCDSENDIDITVDTSRVVWSYHSQDPASEDELEILQHERMGASSLNFLGGLSEERIEEQDPLSFTILNDNVLIPKNDTTYWCTIHALPNEIATREKFIYKYSPVIPDSTAPFVHHIVVYLCSNLDNSGVGDSELCDGTHIDIRLCRFTGIVFAGWAVGGNDFLYPNGVGYPIGGKGEQFIVLELHYDNQQMIEGMVDNSGMEFFYTNEAPENRAGLLVLAQQSLSTLVIPPRADNFVVNALYPEQCSEKFLPREGVNVFGSLLHTHITGHGLVVKHLRNTEECNGLEELEPLDQNIRYDFNYQQVNILPRTVKVLPGDILHLQCSYQTSGYQTVTLGGESTREEMCVAFLHYYPESDLTYTIGYQVAGDQFAEQYLQPGDQDALLTSYANNDHQSVNRILNQVEWNQQSVDSFQNAVHSNTISTFCVNITNLEASILSVDALPQVDCPYIPPSKDCTISGAGKVYSINVYYVFLLCAAIGVIFI